MGNLAGSPSPVTRYPSVEAVGRINDRTGGGGLATADVAGVEAALARPEQSAFGEDAFPTLWEKAGALLHRLASTQYFADGNKRTAWTTAVTFLGTNGVRVPRVEDIESEASYWPSRQQATSPFPQAAEWFEVTCGRVVAQRQGDARRMSIIGGRVKISELQTGPGQIEGLYAQGVNFLGPAVILPFQNVEIIGPHFDHEGGGIEGVLWDLPTCGCRPQVLRASSGRSSCVTAA